MKTLRDLLGTAILIVAVAGCQGPFSSQEPNGSPNAGRVVISVDTRQRSALMPGVPGSYTSYEVRLTRAGFDPVLAEFDAASPQLSIDTVAAGNWTLEISGLSGDTVIARSTVSVEVVASETTDVAVTLSPLQEAAGELAVSLSWPAGEADGVQASLTRDGTETDITDAFTLSGNAGARDGAAYTANHDSGSYLLTVTLLRDGAAVATIMQAVSIFDHLTTSGDLELTAEEIGQPPQAPASAAAVLGANSNQLSWVDAGNTNEEYELQRYNAGSSQWQTIARLGPTATSHEDTVADPASQHYRIRAVNDYGPTAPDEGWVYFPTYPTLFETDDLGRSSSDNLTSATKLDFSIGIPPDIPEASTIRLSAQQGADTQSAGGTVPSNHSGESSLALDLTEGVWDLSIAFLTGSNELIAEASGGQVTVDTTPPPVPALLRPRIGLNTGADLTPRFKWAPLEQGVELRIQADDNASFSSPEYDWPGLMGTSYEPASPMSAQASIPVGTRYYLRVRATDAAGNASPWSDDTSGGPPHRYVNVGRFDGDFNGDGYSDVVAGAYDYKRLYPDPPHHGRMRIYLGGSDRSFSGPDLTYLGAGDDSGGALGMSVSFAGDVNADGFSDILVSAPYQGSNETGETYLILGYNPVGAHQAIIALEENVDAFLTPYNSSLRRFGTSVAGAGDVNADGYADFLIASHQTGAGSGVFAGLYFGGASMDASLETVDHTYAVYGLGDIPETLRPAKNSEGHVGALFGAKVAGLGDFNGDGYADFAVGAPTKQYAENYMGQVYVFYGADSYGQTALDRDLTQVGLGSEYLGTSLAGVGDFDGDGFDDLVVGTHADRAYLYYGGENPFGGFDRSSTIPKPSDFMGFAFGHVAAALGDIDGDGIDDVGVTDYVEHSSIPGNPSATHGRIAVYSGRENPADTIAGYDYQVRGEVDQSWSSSGMGFLSERLGRSLASPGDVDGDGVRDILVGAPNYSDNPFYQGIGGGHGLHFGRIYIVYGIDKTSDPGFTEVLRLKGNRSQEHLGFSVGQGW